MKKEKNYQRALRKFNQGKFYESISILESITSNTGGDENYWVLHGANYFMLNNSSLVALESFYNALKINSYSLLAIRNIALIEITRGSYEEAENKLLKAIELNSEYAPAHLSLGQLYRDKFQYQRAVTHFCAALNASESKENGLSAEERLAAQVRLVAVYFLLDNHKDCAKTVPEAFKLYESLPNQKSHGAYLVLLAKLLLWWGRNSDLLNMQYETTIHAVGESHALSMHGLEVLYKNKSHKIKCKWIEGCKQYHLINGEQNSFKKQIEFALEDIPDKSIVIFVFGEIDARENEGILSYAIKNNLSPSETAEKTAADYIDFLCQVVTKRHINPIIWGVPASNAKTDHLDPEIARLYLDNIKIFNQALKKQALLKNYVFADVFDATHHENNRGNSESYFDTRHVTPETIARVFQSHLLYPADLVKMSKQFLHVGCGGKRKNQTTRGFNTEQWVEIRYDVDAGAEPDLIGNMLDMSGVADESMDAIYSSHNIEHLYAYEVLVAIKEFLRVLKPDGFLVLTCPDLQSVCQLVAENKLTEAAYHSPAGPIAPIDILYGYRPDLERGKHYMAHKCGFTQDVLIGTLRASGFATVAGMRRAQAPHFDLWVVATKSEATGDEIRALAKEHFPG